jgi:hypothetical protein
VRRYPKYVVNHDDDRIGYKGTDVALRHWRKRNFCLIERGKLAMKPEWDLRDLDKVRKFPIVKFSRW